MIDLALVKAAQQGDARAFERLITQLYDTILRFAIKWCGNRHDAEDITQVVCVKLARVISQFRFESAFSTWLYRLVINTAKDWRAKETRERNVETATEATSITGNQEAVILLHQLLEKAETWGEGFKESLLLVHGEGVTHAEAAAILGVKESTISWRIHEIRKKLALLSIDNG